MDEPTYTPLRCNDCGVDISSNPMLGFVMTGRFAYCARSIYQPWRNVYQALARRYEIRQRKRIRKYDYNRYIKNAPFVALSELELWRLIVRLEVEGIFVYR